MEETITVYCYCCEDFTEHVVFDDEDGSFYECQQCGCVLDDRDDEIIFPEEKLSA